MIKKKCVSDHVLLSTVYSSHNTLRCNLFLDLCTVCSLFLKWKLLISVSLLISWLLLQSFLCSLFVFSVFFFLICFLKIFSFFWYGPFPKSSLICYNILSVLCFGPFWLWGLWDSSSLTRDQTHTPCLGRQSLNHWTTGAVPFSVSLTVGVPEVWIIGAQFSSFSYPSFPFSLQWTCLNQWP